MKHYQKKYFQMVSRIAGLVFAVSLVFPSLTAANPLDLATIPLANSPTVPIQPNLLFVLDDSGSMGWDYMPDWANDSYCKRTTGTYDSGCTNQPPYRSADFNAIYYNPEVTYLPAVNANGSSKGSQTTWTSVKNDAYGIQSTSSTNLVTGYADVEWCTDSSYSDCLRNDNYILPGTVNGKDYKTSHSNTKATGTGLVATGSPFAPTTASRSWGPYYYKIIPGEYCDSAKLTNCQTTQTAVFKYPAKVRWCTSEANATAASPAAGSCQGARVGSFTRPRYPTKFFVPDVAYSPAVPATPASPAVAPSSGTLVITGVAKDKTVSIKCGSTYIGFNGTFRSSASNTASTRLSALKTKIDGTTVNGYYITCSGSSPFTCSIEAPAGASACSTGFTVDSDITVTTNLGPSGGANANPGNPYIPETLAQAASYPGSFQRVDIVSGQSYPKASSRTDCNGATCTYDEEMTNFANWWTYYHTRMQAMKTAASLAFKDIGTDFRVGFMTIHPSSGNALKIDTFNTAHKTSWYNMFFSINPDSATPLRSALAKAGRIYANKENIGGAIPDPVEYSCQQNFTLLTTDGYWNTDVESDVQGVTGSQVGNMDGSGTEPPKYDGGAATTVNTLADVAKYYRDTDLRTSALGNCIVASGQNVCADPAPSTANQKQSMVTLTLGLGADGTLTYTSDYKTALTGDYADISAGTANWPDPITKTEGERIDDLWHAAVNGDGTYFSARNTTDLVNQLKEALASVMVKVGAGAAAATSTLNPVSGDNFAYVASYTTGHWIGNLERRDIDVNTGAVGVTATNCVEDVVPTTSCLSPGTIENYGTANYYCVTTGVTNPADCAGTDQIYDSANSLCKVPVATSCTGTLKSKVAAFNDSRDIKMNKGGVLADFTFGNLSAFQQITFNSTFLQANLSQTFTADQLAQLTGANLVNYLRGQSGYDKNALDFNNRLFRKRQAVLGDVIDSKPAFLGAPTFSYTDPGYDSFVATQTGSRATKKTVFIGSNDGMLHAFDAVTLQERWAYVPTMVIPNMWKLADAAYANKHSYYTDGEPVISDICVAGCSGASATWKTILVAGLNGGGRGYYALDITDPTNPSLLWEFDANNEPNLGYTFGSPVVTKRPSDGKWVVLVTSGYNNIPDDDAFYDLSSTKFKPNNPALYTTGNGQGYLYVLDAVTGSKLTQFATGVGSTATPSGLGKIKAFADDAEKNNTATFVYGGDLLGNLWHFDLATNSVLNFAKLEASGFAQPITTAPELGVVNNKKVIFVGTGKYLELSDLTNTNQQTLYAIKDDNASTTMTNPRGTAGMVQQTISASGANNRVSSSNNVVDFSVGPGWFIDMPDTGERQNVNSQLVLGTLLVPTTVPTSSVCQPAGYGWFNYLDYKTGLSVTTTPASGIVSQRTGSPAVGFNVVYVNGKPKVSVVTADNPTPQLLPDIPFSGSGTGFQSKRTIWRELIN